MTWSITDNQTWISVSSASGSTTTETDQVTVTVNRSGLSPNNYDGTVSITSDGGNIDVSVNMEVPTTPTLAVSPQSLDFGSDLTQLTFDITNSGTGTLDWEISDYNDPIDWCIYTPTSGSTTTEADVINVSIDRSLSDCGYHVHILEITSNGGSTVVGIEMTIECPEWFVGLHPGLPASNPAYDIFIVDENTAYTSGIGFIRKCSNFNDFGSETWTVVDNSSDVYSIFFIDLDGWALTADGVLTTDNGGISWQFQVLNFDDTMSGGEVYFVNNQIGYIGKSHRIFKTVNGGDTWTQVGGDFNYHIHCLDFIDENTGWAGSDFGVIYHTADGGATWVDQHAENPIRLGIDFINSSVGWTTGGYTGTWADNSVFKTTDGGTTWISQGVTQDVYFNDIKFTSVDSGWTVGPSGLVLVTTDGGDTWIDQGFAGVDWKAISMLHSSYGAIIGNWGELARWAFVP